MLFLSLVAFITQTVYVFLVCLSISKKFASTLRSLELYSTFLGATTFIYFLTTIILATAKARKYWVKEDSSTTYSKTLLANYLTAYLYCLFLYICTALPTIIICLYYFNFNILNLASALLQFMFIPLLPCSVVVLLLNFLQNKNIFQCSINYITTFLKTILYVAMLYILSCSDYIKLSLHIIKYSPILQTIFFPAGFTARAFYGDFLGNIALILICVSFSLISFYFITKKIKSKQKP